MRLGIIGAGHVGSIVAYTAAIRGLVDEIYIYDIEETKADSEVADLEDGNSFYPHPVKFHVASLSHLAVCEVIVVALGKIPENSDRLLEFDYNKQEVDRIIPEIMEANFGGMFIVVSNPCDIIAHRVWVNSGLAKEKVIGSGTGLDSVRAQGIIARKLEVSPHSVHAVVLGEHGDSQFIPWSQVEVCQKSLGEYLKTHPQKEKKYKRDQIERESSRRGHRVFLGKGATQFGIGNTVNDILSAIIHNSKESLTVSTLLEGQYGIDGIFISTPCIIGENGVEEVIELKLNHQELEKYQRSAKIIQGYVKEL